MGHYENIQIFEETMKLMESDKMQRAIQLSKDNQKLYKENWKYEIKGTIFKPTISVSKEKTLQAASKYKKLKTTVLNFASATNPGGGVKHGSNAQEECICRCSTLYPCLATEDFWENYYMYHRNKNSRLYTDRIIYTPNVLVFRDDTTNKLLNEKDYFNIDVITCAAPNLWQGNNNIMNPNAGESVIISDKELLQLHIKRITRIIEVAEQNGTEVLILGAFGCGAFENPPEIVAEAFKEVLDKRGSTILSIEFAVYCREFETENYNVFNEILCK